MMLYLQLFYEFFKVGLFAVGGGLATLPFLYDISDRLGWFTHAQLADMIAISEATPGPIGIKMAAYVGFVIDGVPAALAATVGLVLPSVIVILLVAQFLKAFRGNRIVESAFYGLRPASVGLIAAAGYSVMQVSLLNTALYEATGVLLNLFDWKSIALAAAVFIAVKVWKPHPIITIAASAAVGIAFGFAGA